MERRQFLASSALLAGMPLLAKGMPTDLLNQPIEELLQESQAEIADLASFEYWMNSGKRAQSRSTKASVTDKTDQKKESAIVTLSDSAAATPTLGGAKTGRVETLMGAKAGQAALEETVAPIIGAREPQFVVYTPDEGFRFASDTKEDELVEKGDVDVTVLVHALRPSQDDADLVQDAIGGSFRLDFGQQAETPLPPLENALAWSSIGVLSATSFGKKLPKLEALKFDTTKGSLFGSPLKIPLVGGSGQWKWSFYVQKKESSWLKALKFVGSLAGVVGAATPAVFSGLGLPAIAWTSLQNIDKLYAYFHARETQSDWLFQGLQTSVAATAKAKEDGVIGFRKGLTQYLVIPNTQTGELAGRKDLEVSQNGFLVPKGTDPLAASTAATTTATKVTYISLSVNVKSRPEKAGS
jgi:hypothetical protein